MSGMSPATKRLLRDVHTNLTRVLVGLEGLATCLDPDERKTLVDLIFTMDRQNKRLYNTLYRAP